MALATFSKDPNSVLDYTLDWSDWLGVGESIAAVQWIVPTGLTLVTATNTSSQATAFLSGGSDGTPYNVVCRITTDSAPARVDDRTIILEVIEH